jgi:pimeloyl-ACP methyl ester carboxylesterase
MDRIPETTIVIAAVGEVDSNTQPILSKDYAEALAARGLRAQYFPIPGAGHNFDASIRENAAFNAALRELITNPQ